MSWRRTQVLNDTLKVSGQKTENQYFEQKVEVRSVVRFR